MADLSEHSPQFEHVVTTDNPYQEQPGDCDVPGCCAPGTAVYYSVPLIVGWHPKPVEGNTVSLYCDECGELECEHRD